MAVCGSKGVGVSAREWVVIVGSFTIILCGLTSLW